jgi:SAM-dependent methyltransferase
MKFKEAVAPGSILTWLVIKRLVRQHSIKGTFLDVGCGEGYLTGQFLSIGLSGVAVEPSQLALQRMSQRLIGPKRESTACKWNSGINSSGVELRLGLCVHGH